MSSVAFVDNAKVMAKGQVTIPRDVRARLGVSSGDRVSFIVDGDDIKVVNAAVYAMRMLQADLVGEAAAAGLDSDDAINALISDLRTE